MKIKVTKDGVIEIDLASMFNEMPEEAKIEVIRNLSFAERIPQRVMQLVLDGMTDDGDWLGFEWLEECRMLVYEKLNQVYAESVRCYKSANTFLAAQRTQERNRVFDLQRMLRDATEPDENGNRFYFKDGIRCTISKNEWNVQRYEPPKDVSQEVKDALEVLTKAGVL